MSLTIHTITDDSIDHASDIEGLLVSQYKDSANFNRFLSSIAAIKQEIEHVTLDLRDKRILANAEGIQLDGLGELVGLDRDGRTDDEYRTEIGTQIQINLSGGQAEILINVTASITGSTLVQLTDSYPAKINIAFNGTAPANLLTILSKLKAAGVELTLTQISETNPFVFEGDGAGLGFSDDDFLNGGELSEAI